MAKKPTKPVAEMGFACSFCFLPASDLEVVITSKPGVNTVYICAFCVESCVVLVAEWRCAKGLATRDALLARELNDVRDHEAQLTKLYAAALQERDEARAACHEAGIFKAEWLTQGKGSLATITYDSSKKPL